MYIAIDVLYDFNRDSFYNVFYAFHVLELLAGFKNRQLSYKFVVQQPLKETEAQSCWPL